MGAEEQQIRTPIAAAALWRDRSLVGDQAIFSEDSLWTIKVLRALWVVLYAEEPDGSEDFLDNLSERLSDTPPEVPRLCAELLWVMFLLPDPINLTESRKIEMIKEVYDWSGEDLAVTHPLLQKYADSDIGNPGLTFNARRYEELLFLIKAVVAVKKNSKARRKALLVAPRETGRMLDEIPGSQFPQMSHMLRYLLFPEDHEPIFTRRDKRRIVESFAGIPRKETKRWSITQLDEELFRVREQLQPLYEAEELSFYNDPIVATWRPGGAKGAVATSEKRYWIETSELKDRPDRQFGAHALGLAVWSPRRSEDGDDVFALMREVEEGDVIFHFTDNEGVTGVSLAADDLEEKFTCPEGSDWSGKRGYRIALHAYTELDPPLQRREFLSESRFQDDLRHLADKHRSLFFNRQLTLNQGTYLSGAPETLVRILDHAYFYVTKKHLPHVALPASDDLAQPRQESPVQRIEHTLNQVLCGPAGTGKTYTAMVRAVEICDGRAPSNHDDLRRRYIELQAANRIRLVTFHPSFGYSDFIEAARSTIAVTELEELDDSGGRVKPGVFKTIAELAASAQAGEQGPTRLSDDPNFWKLWLGDAEQLDQETAYQDVLNGNFMTLQYGHDLKFGSCASRESVFEQLKNLEPDVKFSGESVSAVHQMTNQMKVGDIVILSRDDRTFQALGRVSGDYEHSRRFEERTYYQTRSVDWLVTYEDNQPWHRVSRKKFSQRLLHQLDPSMLRLNELTNLLADDSRHHPENYVLIIDEIGRGDIAEIFGELITLIDADKRTGASNPVSVLLPASGESFDVPGNLYIIGTLNVADQASVLRGGALRRRFEFEELMPDASLIRGDDQLGTIPDGNRGRIDLRSLMITLNQRIEFIFGRDKILGHAFFMNIRSFEDIVRALHHQIIPQLQEVCDGDWHRIQLVFKDVLGDGQPNHPQIVAHEWQTSCSVLGIKDTNLEDRVRYWIVPTHELTPEAIRKVYSDSG